MAFAVSHPWQSLIYSGAAIAVLYPSQTSEWLASGIGSTVKALGRASADAARQSINEIWNQWEQLRKAHPAMGWLYWPLVAAIYLSVVCLPIFLLRMLLQPVYLYFKALAMPVLMPLRMLGRLVFKPSSAA